MTIKRILTAPDPFLKQISKPVDSVTKEIQDLMNDMLETMYDAPGIGLAAVQIGVPLRVIVIDIAWRNEDGKKEPMYFVNPEIVSSVENLATYEEGCLSVPDQYAEIDRPEKCKVKYLDYDGNEQIISAEGMLATAVAMEQMPKPGMWDTLVAGVGNLFGVNGGNQGSLTESIQKEKTTTTTYSDGSVDTQSEIVTVLKSIDGQMGKVTQNTKKEVSVVAPRFGS